MASKKQKSVIGHDPLAWINRSESGEDVVAPESEMQPEERAGTVTAPEHDPASQPRETHAGQATQEQVAEVVEPAASMEAAEGQDSLVLPESLGIAEAASLYEMLKQHLQHGGDLSIDGSSVRNVDTAGLQLLCLFFLEAPSRGVNVSWRSTSDPLLGAATILNLSEHLKLEAA